jgi:hypothetical protein
MDAQVETSRKEPQAFTVDEFCARNRISHTTFFKLKAQNRAPRMMHLGAAVRISIEAERDWRAAREAPTDTEARLIAKEAAARIAASRRAAKLSAASPNHVSKRPKKQDATK